MPDLRWEEVRDFFDPELMGSLPDLFVPDTTVDDWQNLLNLVTTSGWTWRYEQGETELPLPSAKTVLARPTDLATAHLRVWPVSGVLAIFRFTSEHEIDFDVDLRELQGQEGVDTLCLFLREIWHGVGKPVLMTNEGGSKEHPVLGYDPVMDKVTMLAEDSAVNP
ncbi:hypothetical protein [Nocardioides sp. YR527]|uniref:hypothetical protein n=1 Tax=Nocardioides sp. YR527 TaxID=1881028 RepID=UPI000B839F32|nr:hypothetical protein [Nocardioides sp. YR527]